MPTRTSQHILGTSANLLGFCLIVMTSLHFNQQAEKSLMDELASVVALLLTGSCMLSFLSMRTARQPLQARLERVADYLFAIALIGVAGLILFITFSFWDR